MNQNVFIPKGSIHRIENIYKKPVKIVEAQLGNILKELTVIKEGGSVNISTPYTMHNAVNITKKKSGIMYLCKLHSNDEIIYLSYFV